MRLRVLALLFGACFLFLTGFRPGTLPYLPGAAYSDAAIAHWPAAHFLRASLLERGAFPDWRETTMSGQPFAANPLNKTAYPLQWLVLLLPPVLHLDLLIVLHFLLAGWGMYRWVRHAGMLHSAALFAGLAYALAPRLVGHTGAGHLDVLYALAWWPWLMLAVAVFVSGKSRLVAAAVALGLVAALVLLADVRVSLFAFATAVLYGLWLAAGRGSATGWRRPAVGLLLAFGVFTLLSLAVVVPVLAWQPFLSRSEVTPDSAGLFSLEPAHFLGLLGFSAHAGVHETQTYVGLTVLLPALAVLALRPRRYWFWGALFLAAALYALGSNGVVWPLLAQLFPGLLWFRVPSRAWLVVALVLPFLAGYGVHIMLSNRSRIHALPRRKRRRYALALVALLSALFVGGLALLTLPGLARVGVTLILAAVFAVLVALVFAGRLRSAVVAPLLLLLLFAELTWSGVSWLSWRGREAWLDPYMPLAERIVAENPERLLALIYGDETEAAVSFPQEVAEVYGLRLFGGVDPYQLAAVAQASHAALGLQSQGYSVVLPPVVDGDVTLDAQVLSAWDVSHIVSAFPIVSEDLVLLDTVEDVFLYVNLVYQPTVRSQSVPDWPATWPGLPAVETVAGLNRLTFYTHLLSLLGFIVCGGLLLYAARR